MPFKPFVNVSSPDAYFRVYINLKQNEKIHDSLKGY